MRKIAVMALICLLLAFSACNTDGTTTTQGNGLNNCPATTNTTTAPKENGNITLTVSGFSSSPAEDAQVKDNLQRFTRQYPNIKINWAPIPGDYPTKMRSEVASNSQPDVFYLRPDMSSEYISAGKVLNLSPYMQRDQVQTSSFYPSLLTPFTCRNNQIYGLPKDWNTLSLFYNKQMFKDAAIPDPSDQWTWSDMQAAAKKLTKPGNASSSVYGITIEPNPSRWGAFLFANGGQVLNKTGDKSAFNTQAGIDALNFFTGFVKDGSAVTPQDVAAGWSGDAFGKRRAAMALEGGWLIPYLKENFKDLPYGIAPLPIAPTGKRANLIFTNAWAASSSTAHAEACWELIRYMTSPQVQRGVLNTGFALPTLRSMADDIYFVQNPEIKTMFQSAEYGVADYYGSHDKVVHDKLANAIERVELNKADAKTALNDAAFELDTELLI